MNTSTTTRRTTRKRQASRYTPEQIAAFRAADKELTARADAVLSDPTSAYLGDYMTRALTGQISSRIMNYSLRNQMLLATQADERGIILRDVDTRKGWSRRGRAVRREELARPLRIVAYYGADDSTTETTAAADETDQDASPPYRTVARYEISQTEQDPTADPRTGHDSPCAHCAAAPGEECGPACTCPPCIAAMHTPGEQMSVSLIGQLEAAGYRVHIQPGEAPTTRVDHGSKTVHLGDDCEQPEGLTTLAAAVATAATKTITKPQES